MKYLRVGERTLVIRFWRPAVRWTWPVRSETQRDFGLGQRTSSLGFGTGDTYWPHWVEYRADVTELK